MTSYLMALDDRIAVAAPSCFITSLERLFATIGPQDAEQNITGQVAAGLEHADFITMRAPKPTLLTVGTRDFFDIQGSWDSFREVKLIYGRLGFGERVDLFESDEPHGFTTPQARGHGPLDETLAIEQRRRDRRARFPDRDRRRAAVHAHRPGPERFQGRLGVRPQPPARAIASFRARGLDCQQPPGVPIRGQKPARS